MTDEASVIVSRPPADIHLEVEGQVKTAEIIKFSESKSRKVKSVLRLLKVVKFIGSVPNVHRASLTDCCP